MTETPEGRAYRALEEEAGAGSLWADATEDERWSIVRAKIAADEDAAVYESQLVELGGLMVEEEEDDEDDF